MKKSSYYLMLGTTTFWLVFLLSTSVVAQEKPIESLAVNNNLKSRIQDLPSFFNLILPFLSAVFGFLPSLLNRVNNSQSQIKLDLDIRDKIIQTGSESFLNIQQIERRIQTSYERLYHKSLLDIYLGGITLLIVFCWLLLLFFNDNLAFKWWYLIPMTFFTLIGISAIIGGWQGKD